MKKKIALISGGYSGEAVISIASAKTIFENMDKERYDVYPIIIDNESWRYDGEQGQVKVDKNDFSIQLSGEKITFDLAFIVIHGSPGEDGKLQGYFDLIGLPYTTCNALVSALTFNKYFCNQYLRSCNVANIARSSVLDKRRPYSLGTILESLSFPLFVKPNESGSSLGISKVKDPAHILSAIEDAFKESPQIMIEEFIEGIELTIGVYKNGNTTSALPATELVSKNDFFDYEAKYTKGITDEITPARISEDMKSRLEKTAIAIYDVLNCEGMVRIDFILQNGTNKLYFLEVNTVPGQSENSIIPQQIIANGMTLKEFYNNLAASALNL